MIIYPVLVLLMICFFLSYKPQSYNASPSKVAKENYKNALINALNKYNYSYKPFEEEMDIYGIMYYFYQKDVKLDVDNISKPVWDNLKTALYDDDKQVKMRIVASFDMNKYAFQDLDISKISPTIVMDLLEAIETKQHIIYLECGNLHLDMFTFNLEK